jgi:VWFA-related protein
VSTLLALWAVALAAAAGRPTFETTVENVRLDVSVTEDGLPVRTLRAENFEVEDDGVRQDIELVGQDATAIHAVLALDTSQSVQGARLERLKTGAHAFVEALRDGDALSILTFSECTDLSLVGSRDRREAHAAIERASARQTTGLHDAAIAALALADPALGRPLVLVFSDGQDVGSFMDEASVTELARTSDAVVQAVLPPAAAGSPFLTALTDETGGRVWSTGTADDLDGVFLKVLDEFRSRYRLRYVPQGVKTGGWHRIKVRLVGAARHKVRARPGYRHAAKTNPKTNPVDKADALRQPHR